MACQATSQYSVSTSLSADSVEAHPFIKGLFALGTYQVDQHELKANLPSSSSELEDQEERERGADCVEERMENLKVENEETDGGALEKVETSGSPAYSRRGRITLRQSQETKEKGRLECEIAQSFDTPAILDMKWSLSRPTPATLNSEGLLGIAQASGDLAISSLSFSSSRPEKPILTPLTSLRLNPRKALCLSLDWSDRVGGHLGGYPSWSGSDSPPKDTSLIASQSDGSLAYLPSLATVLSSEKTPDPVAEPSLSTEENSEDENEECDSEEEAKKEKLQAHSALNLEWENKPRGLERWNAHGFEAWIAAFDCWSSGKVVWSGGDDLKLKGWDVRSSNSKQGRQATFTHQKSFEGGVTSLQSHHLRQHLWAVGSYDSHLRLFDSRNTLRPLSTTFVGGGVWRIKWHPTNPSEILLGCMHDGFKVLALDSLSTEKTAEGGGPSSYPRDEMEIITRFDAHESLAYGCDWDRGRSGSGSGKGEQEKEKRKIISCSFYDAMMHIWQS